MSNSELNSVVYNNQLKSGELWTMPILFNIDSQKQKALPRSGVVGIKSAKSNLIIGLIDINKIEKIDKSEKLLKAWFGTADKNHPGVSELIKSGDYIISGKPSIVRENIYQQGNNYTLTPNQLREIFYQKRWHNIIGFHTRNIVHRGHEYIQMKALEMSNADAILISPVTGPKKKGDFKAEAIIASYQKMILNGAYNPYGVLLGSFNTYSRYCGPREAIFTALCRKNYGCNNFIVGRDHAGVGNYYSQNASINIFKEYDLGMNILSFNPAYYYKDKKIISDDLSLAKKTNVPIDISGTKIREYIINNKQIPDYLMRSDLAQKVQGMYNNSPDDVFHK